MTQMQGKIARLGYTPPTTAVALLRSAATLLIVEAPATLRLLDPARRDQSVVLTQKHMLAAPMLHRVRPDVIVAPLIQPDWDIVDLAITLADHGFRGDVMALTRPLPRAELVVREVAAVCPGLRVHLLESI